METYEEFIDNILNTRGRFSCGEEYHERHHILPRCMGGSDDDDNLIDLFAREHFIAHKLLAKENPENDKLTYAWWMMSHVKDKNQQRVEITPEEYEEARTAFSEVHSAIISQILKGHKVSAESRIKISINHADVSAENNPMYGKHHTEEAKLRVSNANKGRKSVRRNCTPVICVELNRVFEDATAAGKELNIDSSAILKCCRGERKTCGGYRWNFINKEDILGNNIS